VSILSHEFGEGNEYLSADFTQCQRSDGSIYGSRGGCNQKGSREVSTDKRNTLFSNANTNREGVGIMMKRIGSSLEGWDPSAEQIEDRVRGNLARVKLAAPKMREGDLRAALQNSKSAIKLAMKMAVGKDSNKAAIVKKGLKDAIKVLYNEMAKRQKAEGRKPETLTSMLSNENLSKID